MLSETIRNLRNVAHGGVGGWGAELQDVRSGSIRDSDIGIILWHNPSGCNMALGSTQSPKKWVTRQFPGVKAASA